MPAKFSHVNRLIVVSVAAALALSAITGCGSDADESASSTTTASTSDAGSSQTNGDTAKIKVVLDWTPNTNHAGMFLADANGWYGEAGLDVEFVEPGDSASLQLLAADKAEIAVSTAEEVLPARAQGIPVKSIAAIIEHNTSSLVSLESEGITRPAELAGKRYGGWGGQLEESLVRNLVECDGGDPASVDFVSVGEADYRIGLERDQYDFVWIFDGWDGVRLQEIDGVELDSIALIDHQECIPDWYTPVLATSDDVADERADDIATFIEVTRRGYQAAIHDPAAAADALLAVSPDLDPELVRLSAQYLASRFTADAETWGTQQGEVWETFSDYLVGAGLIEDPEAFDPADAWTNDFLPAA